MSEITITAGPDLAGDLRLVGLQLVYQGERCACRGCQALDRQFDVDALAVGPQGLPCLVSYRAQPEYDFETLTIRWANDNGNEDVQARKIVDGRSKADLFVQGYPSGVSWSLAEPVRTALALDPICPHHERIKRGKDGQLLRILCAACCPGIHYVPRVTVSARAGSSEFDDPEFVAAWTA
jgi:hypothetical protein